MKKLALAIALASCSLAVYADEAVTTQAPAAAATTNTAAQVAPTAAPQVAAPAPAPVAAAAPAAPADLESLAVINSLRQKYPATNFTNVVKAPLAGIFEITMGKNIAYTDAEGRYLMFGSLYDMQTRQDLTAPKRAAAEKVDVSKFPLADAFTRVKGDGSRKIYLFTDPDCPYCHDLENKIFTQLENVTIYTFIFPIESLHPQAKAKAESIWCLPEADRAVAWDNMMKGVMPASSKCANPIDRNIGLAESLGVQGTPTMFSEDGRKMPGLGTLERLESWLNGGA
ncbi:MULTISPECIES: DsbC family protein [Pseudomonas]|uniref:Thiol:disulfide interchange protein n=2 Tax=Pseudomonas TaxID=286 RepID=A0A7X1GJC1_9PSED|nr:MULTISPECIES: DsbC family protein [Pseudomonas]MBC2693542.1 DsbC family protein [Pseudomonas kielensis]MDD1010977.1 DsbC family protein [Pseudomonas shahriarae]